MTTQQQPTFTPRGKSTSAREVAYRHDLFVNAYAEHGDAAAAAIAAGYSPKRADIQGGRLLRHAAIGPRARFAREQRAKATQDAFQRQQQALREAADGAIATLNEVAKAAPRSDDGKVDRSYHLGAIARVQAAVAILDRAGHKPIERIDQRIEWADVTREMGGVDVRTILVEALQEVGERPALPAPDGE